MRTIPMHKVSLSDQTRGEYIHHRYIVKNIILCFHNIVKISVLHHNIAISTKFLWNCFSDFFCLYPPEKSFLRPKATQESPLVVKKILWSSKNSLKKVAKNSLKRSSLKQRVSIDNVSKAQNIDRSRSHRTKNLQLRGGPDPSAPLVGVFRCKFYSPKILPV